uniref:Uncharacterized protein n=1 Tax=Chromera velia CCMP2878 TaxID=1169474 RepID=A0A0G4FXP4_9ALVE|eukprot:Cvel_3856.t1-p1 / transcript=Cvel_3856.t1 / gene=Cvel_3856 / organism=Chromera_velia_CCMP2878 / gene_product=hypothetical protein / transcript_product=hypothetical protein / location=Cvel_scaffold163:48060-49215(-) / protein_length=148 / sequence_SO=supercontig / SO=protein_coding / is_pseudo=false
MELQIPPSLMVVWRTRAGHEDMLFEILPLRQHAFLSSRVIRGVGGTQAPWSKRIATIGSVVNKDTTACFSVWTRAFVPGCKVFMQFIGGGYNWNTLGGEARHRGDGSWQQLKVSFKVAEDTRGFAFLWNDSSHCFAYFDNPVWLFLDI